jgi:hypothetical protein
MSYIAGIGIHPESGPPTVRVQVGRRTIRLRLIDCPQHVLREFTTHLREVAFEDEDALPVIVTQISQRFPKAAP